MKKKIIIIVSTTLILIITIGISIFFQNKMSEVRQRENLAKEFGLDPKLYSHDPNFPDNYLFDLLVPGIPISQVHQIIRGYKTVFTCESSIEIYYFYSTSEEKADRIAIFYDLKDVKPKKLRNVMIEDKNSSSIYAGNCTPGLLKETN